MFDTDNALLLVIDVQGKLANRVKDSSHVIDQIQILIQTAQTLQIPIIYTEQAPEKIGPTIEALSQYLQDEEPIFKTSFSCMGQPEFCRQLDEYDRNQIIVCGIETHVCVFQTVADLIAENNHIKVVRNAVSARHEIDHHNALALIENIGAELTTTETIICELMKTADHPAFKSLMKFLK